MHGQKSGTEKRGTKLQDWKTRDWEDIGVAFSSPAFSRLAFSARPVECQSDAGARRTYDHDGEVEATLDSFAMNLLRQTGEAQTLVVVVLTQVNVIHTPSLSTSKVKHTDIAVRSLTCHTATGTHMQDYLPPERGDVPAVTPAEAGTRLSDPEGCKAELT